MQVRRGRRLLVDELIVHDGGSQKPGAAVRVIILVLRFFALRVARPDHAALAQYVAVLLAGDFFRHLKHHLDQGVHGQLLRSLKEQAGLAEVFDFALVPRAGAVYPVPKGQIQLQAACTRRPGGPLLPGMAAPDGGFGLGMLQALGAAHGGPIIFVLGSAQQANLVVLAVSAAAWPGELVGAAPKHKNIHDFLRHDGYFRADHASGRRAIITRRAMFG